MTTRVRFAPSPTGLLHIGGARTALYNYLFTKATGGVNILRVEDTDLERSTKEYEENVINELAWLGIEYDEGPLNPGSHGPYRQSERLEIYKSHAEQLVSEEKAYYCFCTDEELDRKREAATAKNEAPHYDGTCKHFTKEDVSKKILSGEKGVVRFSAPQKTYTFTDKVRKEITFGLGMVGDFVILRSNGLPVYNFCCVIDDWKMEITHVLRAEDHLPNTLRQLMLYEAFGVTPPEFCHLSLLIGKDRQKLSKRHGATSVTQYREDTYLPEAMNNYLCMLGWSHPEEKDIFSMEELKGVFNLDRFTKSPAVFDLDKFRWVNGQHLREMSAKDLFEKAKKSIPDSSLFHKQSENWQKEFLDLFKIKVEFFNEYVNHIENLFDPEKDSNEGLKEIYSWESTPQIVSYIKSVIENMIQDGFEFAKESDFEDWANHLKKEMKIKGKFLFKGLRGVITGKDEGPDVKRMTALTPLTVILKRLG